MFTLFEDWQQTKDIKNQPRAFIYEDGKTTSVKHYEGNKILGKFPSSKDIDLYFAISAIAHTGIAYVLPEKYAKVWQFAWIGVQTKTIDNNYEKQNKSPRLEYNLKFKFNF